MELALAMTNFMEHLEVGRVGELLAQKILKSKNFKILETNFRTTFGEIDIIAKDPKKTLRFIEVKTLKMRADSAKASSTEVGDITPENNLTRSKLFKLQKICQFYANKYPDLVDENAGWQIDLIALEIDSRGELINSRFYENIF